MDDYREFVAQMREAAPRHDDVMEVSKELWLLLADKIEELSVEIENLAPGLSDEDLSAVTRILEAGQEGRLFETPCRIGDKVLFHGEQQPWSVAGFIFGEERQVVLEYGELAKVRPLEQLIAMADVVEQTEGERLTTAAALASSGKVGSLAIKGKALAVPCLPGAFVRFKGCKSAWKVVCINFYAEGIPTASVTNGKVTNTMPLDELTEAEVLR